MNDDQYFLRTLHDLFQLCQPGRDQYDRQRIAGIVRLLLLERPNEVTKVNTRRGVSVRYRVNDFGDTPFLTRQNWSVGTALDPDLGLPPFDAPVAHFSHVTPYTFEETRVSDDGTVTRVPGEGIKTVFSIGAPTSASPGLPAPTVRQLDKDHFLQHVCMTAGGRRLTVAHVVDFVGCVRGPMHRIQPGADHQNKETRRLLREMANLGVAIGSPGGILDIDVHLLTTIGQVVYRGLQPLRSRVEADLRGTPPTQ